MLCSIYDHIVGVILVCVAALIFIPMCYVAISDISIIFTLRWYMRACVRGSRCRTSNRGTESSLGKHPAICCN